jgi:tRNA nucleotidyltransferase (CCA-adding enzyme)
MKFYLTGGAIRDELLGKEVCDKDYIIIDANKDQLLEMDFEPVGRDYEVYLHPITKEAYSLALDNDLDQELGRRDLTVNAIAKDEETGEYYDPYGGREDIQNRVLKHTSQAFSEDPIRILRIARFKCKYPEFSIHENTIELCLELSKNKNLFNPIAGERIFLELRKALSLSNPVPFFERLREWGTLKLFFSELSQLWGVQQTEVYRHEEDCWVHSMLVLQKCCEISSDFSVRFASLVLGLGRGVASSGILPSHTVTGIPLIEEVATRFKLDAYSKNLSISVCSNYLTIHRAFKLKPSKVLNLLTELNAFRQGPLFEDVLLCCSAEASVRSDKKSYQYTQSEFLLFVRDELANVSLKELTEQHEGKVLGEMIKHLRIREIKTIKQRYLLVTE